jgi:hypothetical protein
MRISPRQLAQLLRPSLVYLPEVRRTIYCQPRRGYLGLLPACSNIKLAALRQCAEPLRRMSCSGHTHAQMQRARIATETNRRPRASYSCRNASLRQGICEGPSVQCNAPVTHQSLVILQQALANNIATSPLDEALVADCEAALLSQPAVQNRFVRILQQACRPGVLIQ